MQYWLLHLYSTVIDSLCWFLCLCATNMHFCSDVTQIQRESQTPKVVSAKFQRNTQKKYAASTPESQVSNVSLLEVLRRSSVHTDRFVQNTGVQQNQSVFEAFKLTKKSIKTEGRV